MKTAEEILKTYPKGMEHFPKTTLFYQEVHVLEAMEEYANQFRANKNLPSECLAQHRSVCLFDAGSCQKCNK